MTGDSCGKCHSETIVNVIVGFSISYLINYFILPYFAQGISEYSVITSLIVTMIFTISSYARGYSIRRLFAKLGHNYTLLNLFKAKL